MPETITLTVTPNETNVLLQALGNLPYAQVVELVGKVMQQAQQQLQPAPAAAE